MNEETYAAEVEALLQAGDSRAITEFIAPLHPSDIAVILETLDREGMVALFRLLTPEVASEVFVEVEEIHRESLMRVITSNELVEVVDEMDTDDAADVIGELPEEEARKVLEGLDEDESIEVQRLMSYAEDTAGGKMQAELISVYEDATVNETIEKVRSMVGEVDNISNVFVINPSDELTGVVPLEKLLLAKWNDSIKELIKGEPVKAETSLDQEEVARLFQRYNLLSMPVVDAGNKLVGRITVDDIVDVLEAEIFEDFHRLASLNIGERALDPILRSFKMRSPWLLLNLITAFFAATVVKFFEGTIETLVILAVLMPVVAGLGGNAATQTITVIIRGLALGDISSRNAKRVLFKEAMVGLFNGLVVGAVAALAAYLLGASMMIGLLLFLAMSANLLIAGLGGAIAPLILKRLNIDPALSASIFVTACTDVGGFFIFLGLAAFFMKIGLL